MGERANCGVLSGESPPAPCGVCMGTRRPPPPSLMASPTRRVSGLESAQAPGPCGVPGALTGAGICGLWGWHLTTACCEACGGSAPVSCPGRLPCAEVGPWSGILTVLGAHWTPQEPVMPCRCPFWVWALWGHSNPLSP